MNLYVNISRNFANVEKLQKILDRYKPDSIITNQTPGTLAFKALEKNSTTVHGKYNDSLKTLVIHNSKDSEQNQFLSDHLTDDVDIFTLKTNSFSDGISILPKTQQEEPAPTKVEKLAPLQKVTITGHIASFKPIKDKVQLEIAVPPYLNEKVIQKVDRFNVEREIEDFIQWEFDHFKSLNNPNIKPPEPIQQKSYTYHTNATPTVFEDYEQYHSYTTAIDLLNRDNKIENHQRQTQKGTKYYSIILPESYYQTLVRLQEQNMSSELTVHGELIEHNNGGIIKEPIVGVHATIRSEYYIKNIKEGGKATLLNLIPTSGDQTIKAYSRRPFKNLKEEFSNGDLVKINGKGTVYPKSTSILANFIWLEQKRKVKSQQKVS